MALATAAPTIPSTIFITSPISLFINCSASQPATPPMMMAAIQPTCVSSMAVLLKKAHPAPRLVEDYRILGGGYAALAILIGNLRWHRDRNARRGAKLSLV